MSRAQSTRELLVRFVQQLEALEVAKYEAAHDLKEAFNAAQAAGFDPGTLRVVLRLRKMSPEQRKERRALEAIYMASLGMLDGDPLPDEARRRLDGRETAPPKPPGPGPGPSASAPPDAPPTPEPPPQQTLQLKDPEEARQEGRAAAAAGKRIYDNPYPSGDSCRAAWDEGWCEQRKSHGMDPPAAYQRRSAKPPGDEEGKGDGKGSGQGEPDKKGDA